MNDQLADRLAQLFGYAALQAGQFHQVAVRLFAEIKAMGVNHQLHRPGRAPEIEQADARELAGIAQRHEGGDGRRAVLRIVAQPLDDPLDLIPALIGVVE